MTAPHLRYGVEPHDADEISVDAVDRSPLKIQVSGNIPNRTRVKAKARMNGPRNRCTWGGSVPSELNHFTNSAIGRYATRLHSYIDL